MKNIKVLGSGCTNCKTTAQLIKDIAEANGVEINLEKVEDLSQIMAYGVMSTPAVIIDEDLIHKGSVPTRELVESWLLAPN
ncbi:thioredoxin family protein [Shewanella benthica]|uniref:Thiol-disulfide isomerase/thioredoxin n=1 Tax=Shewanella benthica KT99 TaxID=314608 RepID=A9DDB0_9GAMM|nr:thioredoxin family protein [Shewanella benthica]EDQ00216.1 thiol-disulfide isomerase/thioredoxin [Shewanella benthica KT99]